MSFSREPHLDPSDIKLLRLFVRVVECGGFAGAQAELNVAASTISTQMATLESRLGMRLCTRGRVGFSLTDKGRRVYAAAKRLEDSLDAFRSDIGELRGKLVGELNVAVVDSTVSNPGFRLHEVIARFAARDNAVHITMHILEPAMIEKRLLDGSLQVGIGAFYHHVPGLVYEHLLFERQGLFCGPRHALYREPADRLDRGRILACDYVARGYLSQRQVPPIAGLKVSATAFDMEAALLMIRSGAYIGHLPVHYAGLWSHNEELRSLMPEAFGFDSDFEFVTRKAGGELRVVAAFLNDLRAAHGLAVATRPRERAQPAPAP